MKNKVEITISVIVLIVAIMTFLFGDNIYYQITGKSFAEDFKKLFIQQPTPTPVITITPTSISKSSLYDDFNSIIEKNGIDYSRWDVRNENSNSCNFTQNQGYLEVRSLPFSSRSGCYLYKISSNSVGNDLETWEMKIRVPDNFQSNCCGSVGIAFSSDSFSKNGSGWVECALHPASGTNTAVFKLVHKNEKNEDVEEFRRTRSTTLGEWHILRLSVDSDKFEFHCSIDDSLLGSVIPKDKTNLQNASFSQYLQILWPSNTVGTYNIDDVRIYP